MDEDYSYEVLSVKQLSQEIAAMVHQVSQIIEIPPPSTRKLLQHFKWDKDRLLERYYEGNRSALFEEAKVVKPRGNTKVSNDVGPAGECPVCVGRMTASTSYLAPCGHRLCDQCWAAYISTKITGHGMSSDAIPCPTYDCDILLDDDTILHFISDPEVEGKYHQYSVNSFVEANRLLRWCPKPGCSNLIKLEYVASKPVTCKCRYRFCLLCSDVWHGPVPCEWLKLWLQEGKSGSKKWIEANTKNCPGCKSPINKDGGCNYMTCGKCKAAFCWSCLQLWGKDTGNHEHACNKYQPNPGEAKLQQTAQELKRFTFYYDKYLVHKRSLVFEENLMVKLKENLVQGHTSDEVPWYAMEPVLRKATDALCNCRTTLMYTYVFAFFLVNNNECIIFEDNQSDLEISVEKLSQYLERDIYREEYDMVSVKILDKTTYCEKRTKVLLAHVADGSSKDTWVYRSTDMIA